MNLPFKMIQYIIYIFLIKHVGGLTETKMQIHFKITNSRIVRLLWTWAQCCSVRNLNCIGKLEMYWGTRNILFSGNVYFFEVESFETLDILFGWLYVYVLVFFEIIFELISKKMHFIYEEYMRRMQLKLPKTATTKFEVRKVLRNNIGV